VGVFWWGGGWGGFFCNLIDHTKAGNAGFFVGINLFFLFAILCDLFAFSAV
jgi:hypothetical protein